MTNDPCDEWKPPFWGAFFFARENNSNNCSTYVPGIKKPPEAGGLIFKFYYFAFASEVYNTYLGILARYLKNKNKHLLV